MSLRSLHLSHCVRHQFLLHRSHPKIWRKEHHCSCTVHDSHPQQDVTSRKPSGNFLISAPTQEVNKFSMCALSSSMLLARRISNKVGLHVPVPAVKNVVTHRSKRVLDSPEDMYTVPCRDFMNVFGSSQPTEWAKAVSEAEKVVGYSTSFMSLRCLLSDELANVALHMRKLVGTKHPLLKTAKNFLTDGKHSLQTRGLIILLISKAASNSAHHAPRELGTHRLEDSPEKQVPVDGKVVSPSGGIYPSQRALAEISEMIHTAFLVHRGVVNLLNLDPSAGPINVMEIGNKMAVLSGDFLLASACKALAGLRNTTVVELISKAIGHLTEAAFMRFGNADLNLISTLQPDLKFSDWERYVYLSSGTLIGHSCRGALELTNHNKALTQSAYDFGQNFAWAQQLHTELQPFVSHSSIRGSSSIDLTSAPVLLYLEAGQSSNSQAASSRKPDIKKLMRDIRQSAALDKAKSLCQSYSDNALEALSAFPTSDSRTALQNMVYADMLDQIISRTDTQEVA